MTKNKNNQAIWNTRIKKNISNLYQNIGSSIDIDKRLYKEDITGSIAHVEMLFKQKIISFKIEALLIFNNPSFFLKDLKAKVCAIKFVTCAIKSDFPFFNLLSAVISPKNEADLKSNCFNLEASFILTKVPACILSKILGTAGNIDG